MSIMSASKNKYIKFGVATGIIILGLAYLAFTGVQQSKSYYVTIKELRAMDSSVYAKRLAWPATWRRAPSSARARTWSSPWWSRI